ncbi:MAG TPA: glycosyltransferase family 2 protein [Planctomycetota bacterium]|nr:glycosyltransferase family 2 protein [Planctomycetota bacterium]
MPSRPPFSQSLSIVLPAFNEEDNIEKQVRACLDFLRGHFADYEVIVVNDGSRDRTGEIVDALAREDGRVRQIVHPTNLGYGRALADGFKAARCDLVFYTDSDNQFDVREIKDAIPLIKGPGNPDGADAVFGFRVYRYDSVLRCILSWGYNRLVRVLFRVKVRDVDCAFKMWTREVNDRLTLWSHDFFVDTEMVAKIRRAGFRSVEKGVRHYPRTAGTTSVRPGHIPKTLWTVARMWFRIHFGGRGERTAPAPVAAPASEPTGER